MRIHHLIFLIGFYGIQKMFNYPCKNQPINTHQIMSFLSNFRRAITFLSHLIQVFTQSSLLSRIFSTQIFRKRGTHEISTSQFKMRIEATQHIVVEWIKTPSCRMCAALAFVFMWSDSFAQRNFTPQLKDSLMAVWNDDQSDPAERLKAIRQVVRKGYLNSKPDSALLLTGPAYDLAEQHTNSEFMSWARMAQGIASANMSNYEDALMYYKLAMEIDSIEGNRAGIAKSHNNIANVYRAQGDYATSLRMHEKALKTQQEIADTIGIRSSLVNIGASHSGMGNYEDAKTYYEEALHYLDNEKDITDRAVITNNLAEVYRITGRYQDAISSFEVSLKLFEELNHKTGEAASLTGIALAHKELGNIDEALRFAKIAMGIYEAAGNKFGVVGGYLNIGSIELERGNYSTAINHQLKALKISEEIGHKDGVSGALGNLARIYGDLEDFEKALQYNEQSLTIDREIGNQFGEAMTLSNMGNMYGHLEKYDEAEAHHSKSLTIRQSIGDRSGEATSLINLGKLYHLQENNVKAEATYREALYIGEEISSIITMAHALINLGKLHQEQQRTNEAILSGERGFDLAKSGENLSAMRSGAELLWKAYKARGQHTEALEMLELFMQYRDSITKEENQREALASEFQYHYEKKALADSLREAAVKETIALNHRVELAQKETERNLYASAGLILLFASFVFYQRKVNKNKLVLKEKEAAYQQELIYASINSQENERRRIARDLHDEVGAMLSTLKLQLGAVGRKLSATGASEDPTKPAVSLVDETITNVRRISKDLLPPTLEEFGLAHALEDLADKVASASGIVIKKDIQPLSQRLEVERELALYRVIQEMMNNALKHAEATEFNLKMTENDGRLHLSFSDNGKGFDLDAIKKSKAGKTGLGLKNLENRVGAAGGEMELRSSLGSGSELSVSVPFSEELSAA